MPYTGQPPHKKVKCLLQVLHSDYAISSHKDEKWQMH